MTLSAQEPNGDDARPADGDFDSFFERWYPSVLSYARRFGTSHAEEVAQETLFRAFSCFAELRRDDPLPWLRTVARNVACDMHRVGSRLWPLPEPGETDPADRAEGPEESLLRLERVGHMRAALGDISAEDRRLLHMLVVNENRYVFARAGAHQRARAHANRVQRVASVAAVLLFGVGAVIGCARRVDYRFSS